MNDKSKIALLAVYYNAAKIAAAKKDAEIAAAKKDAEVAAVGRRMLKSTMNCS